MMGGIVEIVEMEYSIIDSDGGGQGVTLYLAYEQCNGGGWRIANEHDTDRLAPMCLHNKMGEKERDMRRE